MKPSIPKKTARSAAVSPVGLGLHCPSRTARSSPVGRGLYCPSRTARSLPTFSLPPRIA
jgi:hypothetical protein